MTRVRLVPAAGHLGHGRLDPLHHAQARSGGAGEDAVAGKAEDVERLHVGVGQRAEQHAGGLAGSPGASTTSPSADS